MTYFVYELWNPLNHEVFYVGMGKRHERPYDHIKETQRYRAGTLSGRVNLLKIGIIGKILDANLLPEIKIVVHSEILAEIYQEEMRRIKIYGRRDLGLGSLANMNDGGSGGTRRIISEDERLRMSQRKLGKSFEDQFGAPKAELIKNAISKSRIAQGPTGRSWSKGLTKEKHPSLLKMSESLKGNRPWNAGKDGYGVGESNNFYGKKHSPESKKLMSISKKESTKGRGNPKAKTFIFTDPMNNEYFVTGEFTKFCKDHGLPNSSMRKAIGQGPIASGRAKDWKVRVGE